MVNYEAWVASDDDAELLDPAELPSTYVMAMHLWPDAFEFLRHHMFVYVGDVIGHAPWGQMLLSLTRRALASDPGGATRLMDAFAAAHQRFLQQYREAMRAMRTSSHAPDSTSMLMAALFGWAAIYETDFPLWFLGMLGKALSTGSVDINYLGGPNTTTAQGSLVNSLATALDGTPLRNVLDDAYDVNLRNSLLHNDYELTRTDTGVVLRDHLTGVTWDEGQLWDIVVAGQNMLQSVLLAAQVIQATALPSVKQFSDCGVMSFTYTTTESGLPLVVISQLWCFRDLDPAGTWLDSATLTLEPVGEQENRVSLTAQASLTGSPLIETDFGHAVREAKWAWVQRLPVAPTLGLGLPEIRTAEGETVEVVGPMDRHFVPARVL